MNKLRDKTTSSLQALDKRYAIKQATKSHCDHKDHLNVARNNTHNIELGGSEEKAKKKATNKEWSVRPRNRQEAILGEFQQASRDFTSSIMQYWKSIDSEGVLIFACIQSDSHCCVE